MDNTQKIIDLEKQIMELEKEKRLLEATNGTMWYIYTYFYSDGDIQYCDITLLGPGRQNIAKAFEAFVEYKEKHGYRRTYIDTFHTVSEEDYEIFEAFMRCETTSIYLGRNVRYSNACREADKYVHEKYLELRKKVKDILKNRFGKWVDDFNVYAIA